jgi:hypothetical protein
MSYVELWPERSHQGPKLLLVRDVRTHRIHPATPTGSCQGSDAHECGVVDFETLFHVRLCEVFPVIHQAGGRNPLCQVLQGDLLHVAIELHPLGNELVSGLACRKAHTNAWAKDSNNTERACNFEGVTENLGGSSRVRTCTLSSGIVFLIVLSKT